MARKYKYYGKATMGRQKRSRLVKEMKRMTGLLKQKDFSPFANHLKRSFEPFNKIVDERSFDRWIGNLKDFREHPDSIIIGGKKRHLSEIENKFLDDYDRVEKTLKTERGIVASNVMVGVAKEIIFGKNYKPGGTLGIKH